MSLEELREEILLQARQQVDQIQKDTAAAVAAQQKVVSDELFAAKEQSDNELKAHKEKLIAVKTSEAVSAGAQAILTKKQELIGTAFDQARNKIIASSATYIPMLVKKAQAQMSVAVIRCNKHDSAFVKDVKVKIDDTIAGGIVAESADGTVSVDYTVDTILEKVRELKMSDVAKVLFP